MSIAIVTPQVANPATTPASSPEASGSEAADFSSVLTTQQVAAALNTPPASRSGSSKEAPEPLAGTGEQSMDEGLAFADAGSILAALGLIPTPAQPTTPVPLEASDSAVSADAMAGALTLAGNTSRTGNDSPTLAQQTDKSDADNPYQLTAGTGSTDSGVRQTTSTEDIAAKIAVSDSGTAMEKLRTTASSGENNPTFAAQIQSANASINGRVERNDSPLEMRSRIHETGWQGEFTQKLTWMVNNDKHSAQITLNPPQLGPIEVSLKIDNGNAVASFVSANQDVREAIESAMPRLREMLASAGIDLGQTNVSAQSFAQQQAQQEGNARSSAPLLDDNDILAGGITGALSGQMVMTRHGNGMVDLFA